MSIPSQFATVGELRRAATGLSEAVLESYWTEGTYPVDPVQVARRLGLEVYGAQLGNDVFGMLVGVDGEAGVIYVDEDQPPTRKRFTIAHEIGHYLDRSSRLDDQTAFIDKRSDESRGEPDEIWANEIAGNLLMPAAALRAAIDAGLNEIQMAARFGVSPQAINYRRRVLNV